MLKLVNFDHPLYSTRAPPTTPILITPLRYMAQSQPNKPLSYIISVGFLAAPDEASPSSVVAASVSPRCIFTMVTVALKKLTRVVDHASRPLKWPMFPLKCLVFESLVNFLSTKRRNLNGLN